MESFQDTEGRTWTPAVTVLGVRRVKDKLKKDLLSLFENEAALIRELVEDPILLADVLWVLCEPEAREAGVTDEQFGRALGGDAIEAATAALLENLIDFFPSPRRAGMKKATAKLNELRIRLGQRAEQLIESPELEALIAKALDEVNPLPAKSMS